MQAVKNRQTERIRKGEDEKGRLKGRQKELEGKEREIERERNNER